MAIAKPLKAVDDSRHLESSYSELSVNHHILRKIVLAAPQLQNHVGGQPW